LFFDTFRQSEVVSPLAGITLLSGVDANTMCLSSAPPQVTVHSKSEVEPSFDRDRKLEASFAKGTTFSPQSFRPAGRPRPLRAEDL
jgi:hypothetical protein